MFKILENIIELIGWVKIAISPLVIGFILGLIVYAYKEDTLGLIIGITLTVLGLIVGIIWATRVWKKQGTMQYLSRVIATPELDNKEEEKN